MKPSGCSAAITATMLFAGVGYAGDLFKINATNNDTGATLTAGGSSIIDLIDDAVNTDRDFSQFEDANATFSLQYGNVRNAMTLTKTADNLSTTLTIPSTGFSRTFTSRDGTQEDVKNQIEDFLKKEGSRAVKDFLKEMAKQSNIAVSDGNPNATTAKFALWTYNNFGMHQSLTAMRSTDENGEKAGNNPQLRFNAGGNIFSVGDFDGQAASVDSSITQYWHERIGTTLGFLASWHDIEGAHAFNIGVQLGVPIRILLQKERMPISWQVTPNALIGAGASADIGAGGLVYGFGGTSIISWTPLSRWTFSIANMWNHYSGQKLSFDDYEIDPGVNQDVLKNGLRADFRFGEGWRAYAGISATNLLKEAAIDFWYTPEIGISYRSRGGTSFEVGYAGDFGDDYKAHGIRGGVNFAF